MIQVEFDVPVAMRAAPRLFADVYRPAADGRYPRAAPAHPLRQGERGHPGAGARRGTRRTGRLRGGDPGRARALRLGGRLLYVHQRVRGRLRHGGVGSRPGLVLGPPSACTAAPTSAAPPQWLAAIAMAPASHRDRTQRHQPRLLRGWTYQGGAFQLNFALSWALGLTLFNTDHLERRFGNLEADIARLTPRHRPPGGSGGPSALEENPAFARGELTPYYRDWIAHTDDDDYWRRWNIESRHHTLDIPALHAAAGTTSSSAGRCATSPACARMRRARRRAPGSGC